MGYGLLPGAGLASAEDMLRVRPGNQAEGKPGQHAANNSASRMAAARAPATSADQRSPCDKLRAKVVTHYCARHGADAAQAQPVLHALFREQFGHPLTEATVPEMSKVINQILGARRGNGNGNGNGGGKA